MPGPTILALILALFLLLLVPTRRLQRAGWPPRALGAYLGGMLLVALLVAELPGPARFLVPLLVLGYLAPFVTAREGLTRLRGGPVVRVERPPTKQVTGPARDVTTDDMTRPADGAPIDEDDAGSGGRTSRSQ